MKKLALAALCLCAPILRAQAVLSAPAFSIAGGTYTTTEQPALTATDTLSGCTTAAAVLTCTSGGINPYQIGATITVPGAGSGGASLTTTVKAYLSATQLTLAKTPTIQISTAESVSIQDFGIYYTVDGSTPSVSSPMFSGVYWNANAGQVLTGSITLPYLNVQVPETVQAIAISTGGAQSAVTSASYVVPALSSSTITTLGVSKASIVENGLGFYMSTQAPQEWALAAASGAKLGRVQATWSDIEQQSAAPANTSAGYIDSSDFATKLNLAKANSFGIDVLAAYNPPFHPAMQLNLTAPAAVGSTSLSVSVASGSNTGPENLTNIVYPDDFLCIATTGGNTYSSSCGVQFGVNVDPNMGTLIAGVTMTSSTTGTIQLASALTKALPASTVTLTGCSGAAGSATMTCTSGGLAPYAGIGSSIFATIPGAGSNGTSFYDSAPTGAVSSDTTITFNGTFSTTFSGQTVVLTDYLTVMEELYPSPQSSQGSDPANIAYANYVSYLANDLVNNGVSGTVETWNEPIWGPGPWEYFPWLYQYLAFPYSATTTYTAPGGTGQKFSNGAVQNAYVSYGGAFYVSSAAGNVGNTPSASSSYWTQVNTLPSNVLNDRTYQWSPSDFGSAQAVMALTNIPSSVPIIWGGTEVSGSTNSLTGANYPAYTGSALPNVVPNYVSQSLHPYSGARANPEVDMWVPSCLAADAAAGTNPTQAANSCYVPGELLGSAFIIPPFEQAKAHLLNSNYGLGQAITETNVWAASLNQETQHARAVMRQYIGFQANGVSPVMMFSTIGPTYDRNAALYTQQSSLAFVDVERDASSPYFCPTSSGVASTVYHCDFTPDAAYYSLKSYLSDIAAVSNPPVTAYSAATLPSVSTYSGTYPLAVTHFVGSRSGATANSYVTNIWQISTSSPPLAADGSATTDNTWYTLPSPPAASVTVNIPAGFSVTSAKDTVTGTTVAYTTSSGSVTIPVADNPIRLIVDPSGPIINPPCILGICGTLGLQGRHL